MKDKYSQKDAEMIFENHGLILIDKYCDTKGRLHCEDKAGYQYYISINGIKDTHKKFFKKNPYTIDNIKLYLQETNSTLKLVSKNYETSAGKLQWKCECGQEFQASFDAILHGKHYCNYCAKSHRFDNQVDYNDKVEQYCKSKNYILMPSDITRSSQYFYYICNKHPNKGIQRITVDCAINSNQGCCQCGAERSGRSKRTDETLFKSAVENVGFIYVGVNYDNDGQDYKKANIEYICPKHKSKGVQTIKYDNLKVSRGHCWYCSGKGRSKEDLQKELNEIGSHIIVLDYINYSSPIRVKCDICGREWTTSGVGLTHGNRCGFCSKSGFELSVCKVLDDFSMEYDTEHIFYECRDQLPLPFDFYISDFNIAIEADGEGHYYPIRRGNQTEEQALQSFTVIQNHDKIKTEYCKKNGISLIRIPFWEKENLQWFLWDELVKLKAIEEIAS